jgi:hypothetical protein
MTPAWRRRLKDPVRGILTKGIEMKTMHIFAGVVAVAVLSAVALASADTKDTASDQKACPAGLVAAPVVLPDAAVAAITKAFPKATMGIVSACAKDDKTYSVAMKGNKEFKVRVSEAGVIISVSRPIAVADLPKAVADAVTAGANGATTDSACKVQLRADCKSLKVLDKPEIVYEVKLVKGDTTSTMCVAEDGTVKTAPEPTPTHKDAPATPQ